VFRRARGAILSVRRRTTGLFRGTPKWAKPSNLTAGIGVGVGVATLLFTPLPDGNDSWVNRLVSGYQNYLGSKNPLDLLNPSPDGNNLTTILALQLKQNAPGAIAEVAGYGVVAGVLRYFGM
jgi:hypothetical protein